MGCQAQVSRQLGVYCSSACSKVMLVLSGIYMAVCLTFTLTTRLYLEAYYVSAHVAGLSTFIGLFVLSHHLFRMHAALNCSVRAYMHVKIVWSVWCLLCCLVTAIAFTWLATVGNLNYDYVSALVFAWVDCMLIMYLLAMSIAGASDTMECNQYDVNSGFTYGDKKIEVYTVGYENNQSSISSNSSTSTRCCRCCCAFIVGLIYLLFHLLFALVVFLTAYHPSTTLYNILNVQNSDDMYTVKVEGHQSLTLFLRCRGRGSETIIYENGLGALAMMQWDFIPRELQNKYKVCVHDRRGYGWSEGFEWDSITAEKQWAMNNAQFFQALIKEAKIETPFYYMGHSYGGIHLSFNAFLYPETIKGLIYLDSASFSPVESLVSLLPVINNFRGLGLLKIALDSGLLDYKSSFGEVINFDYITDDTKDDFLASVATGYYFSAYQTEFNVLNQDLTVETPTGQRTLNYPGAKLNELMLGKTINQPLLVIDAGSKGGFSGDLFSHYNETNFHYAVPGADHQTLVYDYPYVATVSNLIDRFIQMLAGDINTDIFVRYAHNVTGQIYIGK